MSAAGSSPPEETAFAAEVKRSSRVSGATAGPVSPSDSSYNWPHQSSSWPDWPD
ncbi:hypothetical protein GPA10_16335 [Streptomyces sp. p1417]|uniref:Uncharacterized protein n=1 Tax=Streptomyces typhae TaxID=2681492 RepID=A0A6L6WXQ1_9ACTN|nr:hypothetical protein [Streptomyces typhae]MVO86283.1 hypothetical protein [Streptomyces typhae]